MVVCQILACLQAQLQPQSIKHATICLQGGLQDLDLLFGSDRLIDRSWFD